MRKTTTTAAIAAMVLTATAALAAPTAADKCEASKNKTAGSYYACRQKAEALAIRKALPADYSRCTGKFDDKWDAAETRADGACPDDVLTPEMSAWIAGQSSETAAILAGTGVPACGDGVINVPGEHCDGAALGGSDCTKLSYSGGLLACDASCRFDTTGCDCPAGSKRVGGLCWIMAASSAGPGATNCNDACASVGLICNQAALESVGSAGTDEACRAMADILDPAEAPHGGSVPFDTSSCGAATDLAAGCTTYPDTSGVFAFRALHSGSPTVCEADFDPNSCIFFATVARRVCACDP